MKEYSILMPITGTIYKEVQANSEEEALEKFYQLETSADDIEAWDMHEHIVKGNVFYGELNSVEIELID